MSWLTQKPTICTNSCIYNLLQTILCENISTDGSETEEGVAVVDVSPLNICKPYTCGLPDDSYKFTRELRAILRSNLLWYCLILLHPYKLYILKYDRPVLFLMRILKLHMELTRDGKEMLFFWVPSHVSNRGNLAAGSALVTSWSSSSPSWTWVNKYVLYALAVVLEWDEFPKNKLRQIFPKRLWYLDCTLVTLSLMLLIPFYWRERNHQCVSHVMSD